MIWQIMEWVKIGAAALVLPVMIGLVISLFRGQTAESESIKYIALSRGEPDYWDESSLTNGGRP